MEVSAAVRTSMRYHQWASERILDAAGQLRDEQFFRNMESSFGSVFGSLQHTFQADWIWFSRATDRPNAQLTQAPTPSSLPDLRAEWVGLLRRFEEWLERLPEERWETAVAYKNSQGLQYQTPLWQIVLHVVNHGTAHRGQTVAMLRQLGATPPNTDLITYYRQMM